MKMFKPQKFLSLIVIMLLATTVTNCRVKVAGPNHTAVKTKKVPPGQLKKMTGQQSAKKYAPGHNK